MNGLHEVSVVFMSHFIMNYTFITNIYFLLKHNEETTRTVKKKQRNAKY